jgi:hypothetical protein
LQPLDILGKFYVLGLESGIFLGQGDDFLLQLAVMEKTASWSEQYPQQGKIPPPRLESTVSVCRAACRPLCYVLPWNLDAMNRFTCLNH